MVLVGCLGCFSSISRRIVILKRNASQIYRVIQRLGDDKKRCAECCSSPLKPHGTPGQAKPGLTPISCHAVLERSACAPFIKERRMECINATSLHRKSGNGAPSLCVGERR